MSNFGLIIYFDWNAGTLKQVRVVFSIQFYLGDDKTSLLEIKRENIEK